MEPDPSTTRPSNSTIPPVSVSPAARLSRSVTCGTTTIELTVRSDGKTVRITSRLKPEPVGMWDATLVRDRTILWRGKADRGRVERAFPDLPGSEAVLLRLTNARGTVCSAGVTLPG